MLHVCIALKTYTVQDNSFLQTLWVSQNFKIEDTA